MQALLLLNHCGMHFLCKCFMFYRFSFLHNRSAVASQAGVEEMVRASGAYQVATAFINFLGFSALRSVAN